MLLIKICSQGGGGGGGKGAAQQAEGNEVKAKLQALLRHFNKMQKGLPSAQRVWRHVQTSIVQVSASLGLSSWLSDQSAFPPYSKYISNSLLQVFSQPLAFLDVDRETAPSPAPAPAAADRDRDHEAANASIEHLLDPSSVANRTQLQLNSSRNVPRSSLQSIALGSISSEHLALIVDGESLLRIFGDEQAESMVGRSVGR
jgi:hypothetical protein